MKNSNDKDIVNGVILYGWGTAFWRDEPDPYWVQCRDTDLNDKWSNWLQYPTQNQRMNLFSNWK